MLRSPEMAAEMRRRAEKVAVRARALAPVDSGQYKNSFVVSSGRRGGMKRDRAFGRVTNTAPYAMHVETGTSRTPAHHTLRRSMQAAGD
jgi:hypothetical protein